MDLRAFAELAHRLADAAAGETVPRFRAGVAADNKAEGTAFDPVTEADRSAERAMRDILARDVPAHAVLGEEYGAAEGDGRHRWVLDPVDGTRSFLTGVPLWTTIVGLSVDRIPTLGLVDQPYVGDRFWGWGTTALRRDRFGNEAAMRTRPCATLAEATLMTTSPSLMTRADERPRYDALEACVRLARYGADGYAYCLLAAGSVDLVVESGLAPYDIVGIIPIVEAAGGVVTSWSGGSAANGGAVLAAGDRRVHRAAMEMLSG